MAGLSGADASSSGQPVLQRGLKPLTKQQLRPPVHSASHRRHTKEPPWGHIRIRSARFSSAEAPIKAPISQTPVPAASCGIPAQKPVDGAQTAVDVVRGVKQAGPAAAKGSSTAARIAASRARRIARDAAMDWLAATYPAAFGLNGDVKPVAIGVGKLIWPDGEGRGDQAPRSQRRAEPARRPRSPISRRSPRTAPCASVSTATRSNPCLEHQVIALDRLAKIERRLAGEGARR